MPADLPPWALTEEAFADFCIDHGYDETDEAFALYERWLEGDRDGMPFPDTVQEAKGEW